MAFLQELLNLKWAVPARLVFGWRHCATGVHKLAAWYPAPLKNQCRRWKSHWLRPGSGKDRRQMEDGKRCAHTDTRRTQGEYQ